MLEFMKSFFSENSEYSMMRLLSFLCVVMAAGIAIHAISSKSDLSETAVLCGVFLTAGIGGKVIQKVSEAKDGNRE